MSMPADPAFECGLDDFEERVIEGSRKGPILVDFWADWCAPCHAVAPHLARAVIDTNGAVRLAKVEVDDGENMKLAGRFRMRGFPTIILFVDGHEVARFSGARSTHWIENWMAEHL